MPILELQRRLREIGRIRIGEQVPTGNNGKTRPVKLETFRFTSRDRKVIDSAAEQFGGTVESWTSPDGDQWQVKTTTAEISCVVPPGDMAFSQWYELWAAGGCKRRCDGLTEHITEAPCMCDPEARDCKIHSRISLLLTDLPGLGLWRLDTSGYYAAVELGGVVDLAAGFTERGQMLPARLRLEQRSAKRIDADGKSQTLRFAVPILDLDVHPLALVGAGRDAPALGVGSPSFTPVPVDALPPAPVGTIAEQLAQVDEQAQLPQRRNAATPIPPTGLAPRTAAEAGSGSPPASAERPCVRCGQSLLGQQIEKAEGGMAHKGQCPGPFGDDPADNRSSGFTVKMLGAAATKAFPCDDAPPRQKTKLRDRLRYALTYIATNGSEWHLDRLTLEQMASLDAHLQHVQEGRITFAHDDDGATFTLNGKAVAVPWSTFDETAEQQQLGGEA